MRNFLKDYKPEAGSSAARYRQAVSKANESGKKLVLNAKNLSSNFLKKGSLYKLAALAVLVLVLFGGILFVKSRVNHASRTANNTVISSGSQTSLAKSFNVPIRDKDGKETGTDLKVNVTTLERTDSLVYNGSPLTARAGKDFLVISLQVENSTNNRLTVRPVDFARLVGADGKNYAADLQIDPVTVEPLSTKKARTIYIVDKSQKSFKFLIGDVRGSQESVNVTI